MMLIGKKRTVFCCPVCFQILEPLSPGAAGVPGFEHQDNDNCCVAPSQRLAQFADYFESLVPTHLAYR